MKSWAYRAVIEEAPGIANAALRGVATAASWGYGAGVRVVCAAYRAGILPRHRLPVPVVSVGNLTWGGTGKTPLTAHLARALHARGIRAAILTRGYGGDEPEVLRRLAPGVPVYVGPDRVATGRQAIADGAALLLLDDGFQQWRLFRDMDLVLVEAAAPFGTGHLVPRGTLREPPAALRRAQVVVITKPEAPGADVAAVSAQVRALQPSVMLLQARYRPERFDLWPSGAPQPLETLRGATACVLSGIADPAAFEALVIRLGVVPAMTRRFLDHHPYRTEELAAVAGACRQAGIAWLVTTLKDAVRFPTGALAGPDLRVAVLQVAIDLSDEGELLQRILSLRPR